MKSLAERKHSTNWQNFGEAYEKKTLSYNKKPVRLPCLWLLALQHLIGFWIPRIVDESSPHLYTYIRIRNFCGSPNTIVPLAHNHFQLGPYLCVCVCVFGCLPMRKSAERKALGELQRDQQLRRVGNFGLPFQFPVHSLYLTALHNW